MTLLWVNMLLSASASTGWGMWAYRVSRRDPIVAWFYALACAGALVAAVGFLLVVMSENPSASASVARWSVPFSIGAPAIARFIELLREERQRRTAMDLLDDVEERADAHEHAFDTEEA